MSRRHPPRADLGVGLALLLGGLGFLLIALFSGFGPAWQFMGGVAAMTGAGRSYRAGHRIQQHRRTPPGYDKPVPRSRGWSQALPWASELYEKTPKKKHRSAPSGASVCSARCMASTAPRSACRCPCGGTSHGRAAQHGGGGSQRNGHLDRARAARTAARLHAQRAREDNAAARNGRRRTGPRPS